MLNIIHGADFHLDSPFSGLSPERAAQRRGEQRELLSRLAQLARETRADLVLLSGDLMDGDNVYRETAQALSQALGSIPCPVFLAPGNHDCYSPSSVYATLDWPDNVHIFTSPAVEGVDLPHRWPGRLFPPRDGLPPGRLSGGGGRTADAGLSPRGHGPRQRLRPHLPGGDRRQRPGLSGPGPRPPVQRPAAGGADRLGLSRLSRGPGL